MPDGRSWNEATREEVRAAVLEQIRQRGIRQREEADRQGADAAEAQNTREG